MASAVTGRSSCPGALQMLEGERRAQMAEVQAALLVARPLRARGPRRRSRRWRGCRRARACAETAPSCIAPLPMSESSWACTATKRSVDLDVLQGAPQELGAGHRPAVVAEAHGAGLRRARASR